MNISELSTEQISSLIARMLDEKDPASVSLSRIVRRKAAEANDFPVHGPATEEFSMPGRSKTLLSEDERRIIELERQVKDLKDTVALRTERARAAVANAYMQGYEKGRENGLDKGKASATEEYDGKIVAVQKLTASYLKSIEAEKQAMYAAADRVVLELCRLMVKKIIALEPRIEQDIVLSVIKKALSFIAERENLVIRVSPGDVEKVSDRKNFWAPVTEQLKTVSIEPDQRIEKGGCVIESDSGIVDARFGIQIDELVTVLDKAWESVHAASAPAQQLNTPEARDS